jgi:hypothetical protein
MFIRLNLVSAFNIYCLFDKNVHYNIIVIKLLYRYYQVHVSTLCPAGYSFTDDPDGRPRTIEQSTDDLYTTLAQLYTLYPDLRRFPLYLAGQSYSGNFTHDPPNSSGCNKSLTERWWD